LSVFLRSLSPTRLRQQRLVRLKAKCEVEKELRSLKTARRRSKIESREEIRRAKAASRAERAKLAREAKLLGAQDKAAKIKLQRQSRQPLVGIREHPLLIIMSSRHMTLNSLLAYLCVFVIPAIGAGVAAYAIGVHTGRVEITIVLGSAGGTGAVMATGVGVLSYFYGRRGLKKPAEAAQTPNNAKPRQDDEVADPPENESPDGPTE
jgi:hypothetical protein